MNAYPAARAASLLPVPAALVTYLSATGQPRLTTASWTAIVCRRTATLSVALGAAAEFVGGDFVVNLLPDELLASPDLLAAPARNSAPVKLVEDERSGLPVVADCPVRIECAEGAVQGRTLRGRVVVVAGMGTVSPAELLFCRPFAGVGSHVAESRHA